MTSVPSGLEWATDPNHRDVMNARLILRDGPWCHYCGKRFSRRGLRASFDHVWPQCRGRIDLQWNLVLACCTCNSSRGDTLDACTCEFCQAAIRRARLLIGSVAA
jgi:5-methylcytosine-specific restriction endonuclease McrA